MSSTSFMPRLRRRDQGRTIKFFESSWLGRQVVRNQRNRGLTRVCLDDHAQVLRLLAKRHRDLAQSRAETASRLHALLMELQPGGMAKRMNVTRANGILDTISIDISIVEQRVGVARELVADLVHRETQMKASKARLRRAVAAASTSLTDIRGIGVVTAAMIIGHVGNIDRFATAAHFASYNGTAPIEASRTQQPTLRRHLRQRQRHHLTRHEPRRNQYLTTKRHRTQSPRETTSW